MNRYITEYCNYLSELYNCDYYIRNNILFIISNTGLKSVFKVSLNDKRFSVYTLFHKNSYKIKESYHTQSRSKSLKKIIFIAMTHDFEKEINIFHTQNDFFATLNDVEKLIKDKDIIEGYKKIEYITCPICKKRIKVIKQNGELRRKIHCRCFINKHHSTIQYKYGEGYYLTYRGNIRNRVLKI